MSIRPLWGELDTNPILTPLEILKTQASALTAMTKGILNGDVSTIVRGPIFEHTLRIVAPALDAYSYAVVTIQHEIELYPVYVQSFDTNVSCDDEGAFVAGLEKILTSPRTRNVVRALISQSQGT